jgi:hypothetical protein
MTFGAATGSSSSFDPFIEDGITMTPTPLSPGLPHFDRLGTPSGGTSSDADNNAENSPRQCR